MSDAEIIQGDVMDGIRQLPERSVHCVVTSPPYLGLRDYGVAGQIGLEPTPELYVAKMVEVFREVRRVLRDDGTVFLNLGDSYAGSGEGGGGNRKGNEHGQHDATKGKRPKLTGILKPKDLIGIPWRVAFALQADGWWLRSEIIWAKGMSYDEDFDGNPMPESCRDRPAKAHETVFLLAKSARYYYDGEAVKEKAVTTSGGACFGKVEQDGPSSRVLSAEENARIRSGKRNLRDVWQICPVAYKGAHFATFPPKLVEPCILAGCPVGGTVLDPFAGSGTVAAVALKLGRRAIGIELNPEYIAMIEKRIAEARAAAGLFAGA